jgi:hypothetical protein
MVEEFLFPEPASLGVTIFLSLYCSMLSILTIIVCVMLIQRRTHKFLVARDVSTLVPQLLYNCMTTVVVSASIIIGKPPFCVALNVIFTILTVLSHRVNLNIPHFVYQNEINDLKVRRAQELKTGQGEASNHSSWRMIKFFSNGFKIFYLFIIAVVQGVAVACIRYLTDLPGDCLRPSLLVSAASILIICCFVSYFFIRFSKVCFCFEFFFCFDFLLSLLTYFSFTTMS